MKLRLFLVRHGETIWNAAGRYQGHVDVPLSEVGRAQAEALARRLAGEHLDAIYASDLSRAHETAKAIAAQHDLPVSLDLRLREMSFGKWEGMTFAQMEDEFPDEVAWWNADRLNRAPPGGETLGDGTARIQSVLDDVVRRHQDQTVVLVAHGGPLKLLLCLLLNKPPREFWQFRMDNTALSEIEWYHLGPRIRRLNDTYHLCEIP
ncbi:MAG: alpha-ribazole phosphatase [Anaerolineae bacterium]|nr:alpha-ribazole phosphatase [Anaerolineae bacterium]